MLPALASLLCVLVLTSCGAKEPAEPLKAKPKPLPDFSQFERVQDKKAAFFGYMLPMITAENQRILAVRKQLLAIQERGYPVAKANKKMLLDVAERYSIAAPESLAEPELMRILLRRVDLVPASLALAQSANESAWGTSRFARQGNNLFGQWCFKRGCGMVPKARDDGAVHEVAAFKSTQKSVDAYIHNINTGSAYTQLRKLREKRRSESKPIDGYTLAAGLERYSERGHEYIKEIRAMIGFNKLARFDVSAKTISESQPTKTE